MLLFRGNVIYLKGFWILYLKFFFPTSKIYVEVTYTGRPSTANVAGLCRLKDKKRQKMEKRCIRTEDINDFDVTPTYFNTNNASFWARSNQLYGNVTSRNIYVENGLNECRYGKYTSTAPTDVYYYMSTSYGYSSTGVVKSKGYYRP